MPWTKDNYPEAFENLTPKVREKAIEIGNKLVTERQMTEEEATTAAISKAKDWAFNHDIKITSDINQ